MQGYIVKNFITAIVLGMHKRLYAERAYFLSWVELGTSEVNTL